MTHSEVSLITKVSELRKLFNGPTLNRLFELNAQGRRTLGRDYLMNTYEWLGESFIRTVSYALSLTYYCSPIVVYYIYSRGILTSPDQFSYYAKVCATILIGLSASFLMRGLGRYNNPDYQKFYNILLQATKDMNKRDNLQLYDFDFSAWPVDFRWNESTIKSEIKPQFDDDEEKRSIFSVPSKVLEYLLAHGLARPMAWPGSVKLLQTAMAQMISQGRVSLLEKNGLRAKLLARDGNEIDTMFIDRRSDREEDNGNTLVICCEGNAAFYETGIVTTPLKGGYSVLGWNHPGFMGSTGLPFPEAEFNAIDVVVQYAVTRLGYNINDIVMFAWSIGGFSASYATMMYPNMKALVLDATFDDIIQLAVTRMPTFAAGLVKRVITNYMNLNITRHVIKYDGPVLLFRRQKEEIITTNPYEPSTNRGNFLLIKLLLFRYPNIITKEGLNVLVKYLGARDGVNQAKIIDSVGGLDEAELESKLSIKTNERKYPVEIGNNLSDEEKVQATLYLATKYMHHFDATHCVPLPYSYFVMPWNHQTLR